MDIFRSEAQLKKSEHNFHLVPKLKQIKKMYSLINNLPAQVTSLSKAEDSFSLMENGETPQNKFIWASVVLSTETECESDSPAAVCKVITQALNHCSDTDDETDDEEDELRRIDLLSDNMGLFYRDLSNMRVGDYNNDSDDDTESEDEDEDESLYQFESSFSELYAAFHKQTRSQ